MNIILYPVSEKIKQQILEKSLILVPNFGWSEELLNKIEDASVIFMDVKELVEYFLRDTDRRMLEELEKLKASPLKVRQKIRKALMLRFKLNDKDIVVKTAEFFKNPVNIPLSLQSISRTCDMIWRWAGDESTDFNYYSKRGLLAIVYSTALLHYIKNDIDMDDLSIFIENRIDNVLKIGDFKQKISNGFEIAKGFMSNTNSIK